MMGLQPQVQAVVEYVEAAVRNAGGRLDITSGHRSYQQQARLYANRQHNPNPVAPPGTSKHERGLAVDMVIDPPEWQDALGAFWESLGGVWGGRFHHVDKVHFEAPG